MMSEGTKLGVSDEVDSFSQEADLADNAAFSGTKIGEVSAFEKSLYDEGIISQSVAPKVEVKENETLEEAVDRLTKEMFECARKYEFEKAAVIRDIINELKSL